MQKHFEKAETFCKLSASILVRSIDSKSMLKLIVFFNVASANASTDM